MLTAGEVAEVLGIDARADLEYACLAMLDIAYHEARSHDASTRKGGVQHRRHQQSGPFAFTVDPATQGVVGSYVTCPRYISRAAQSALLERPTRTGKPKEAAGIRNCTRKKNPAAKAIPRIGRSRVRPAYPLTHRNKRGGYLETLGGWPFSAHRRALPPATPICGHSRGLMKLLLILLLAITPASAAVVTNPQGCIEYAVWMERTYFTWCPPTHRRY